MPVNKSNILLIFSLSLMLQACIYEYYPNLTKYGGNLVVYGLITNEPGPHKIEIKRTSGIDGNEITPESGAKVSILDNYENLIQLTEDEEGCYYTPKGFTGTIGTRYKIRIILQNGACYVSEDVKLLDVPDIKALQGEYEIVEATQTTPSKTGYQFYIDTDGTNSNNPYLHWEITETWEVRIPYPVNLYWDGEKFDTVNIPRRCWRSAHIKDIFVGNSSTSQLNSLSKFPLSFVTIGTEKRRFKYGITAKQYALSEESYYFWKGIIENTSDQGSMYSKQAYQVVGNIKNIDQPNEMVYGYFEASEVKKKSITVLPPADADTTWFFPSGFEYCESECYERKIDSPPELPAESYVYEFWSGTSFYCIPIDLSCVFCEEGGATSEMPDFWE